MLEPNTEAAQQVVRRGRELWQQRLLAHEVPMEDNQRVVEFLGQERGGTWIRQTELVAGFVWLRQFYRGQGM